MQYKRTKMIATMGPAIDDEAILIEMIQKGTNCFRLNFSHGSAQDHKQRAKMLRHAAKQCQSTITLLADLQGPKIRIGDLVEQTIQLEEGAPIILETQPMGRPGHAGQIEVVGYPNLSQDVSSGHILLLDDGHIQLQVERIEKTSILCRVMHAAILKPHKGVNLKGGGISAPAFTDKDHEDLKTALEIEADFIALSFVRSAEDIRKVRALLPKTGHIPHLIAKIERAEAIAVMDEIIEEADGIMVARGDLAVEVGEAEVPALQKQMLYLAQSHAKISIVATQMMESMILNPHPTRAEISDVANAVLDGTDAVMLSAETASGQYPLQVIDAMHHACMAVEKYPYLSDKKGLFKKKMHEMDEAIAMASIYTANRLNIRAIVTLTESGTTAQRMSRIYSGIPIFALSRNEKTLNRVNLYRNVVPIYFDVTEHRNHLDEAIIDCLKTASIVKDQDWILLTHGTLLGIAGKTNTMKILCVR